MAIMNATSLANTYRNNPTNEQPQAQITCPQTLSFFTGLADFYTPTVREVTMETRDKNAQPWTAFPHIILVSRVACRWGQVTLLGTDSTYA